MTVQGVLLFFGVWFAGSVLAAVPLGAFFWEGDREAPTPDTDGES